MRYFVCLLFARTPLVSILIASMTFAFSMTVHSLNVNPGVPAFSLEQTSCQFSGSFEQVKSLEGIEQDLTSSGVFYHHCDHGVIWSTSEPVRESLVMRRDGSGFIISADEQKQLKSRQGKFLSSLLNSLMSGDQSTIERQFALSMADSSTITLTPKTRTLKRAIKFIEVQRSNNNKSINITIVDRNFQKTQIKSIQTHVFDGTANATTVDDNCLSSMTAIDDSRSNGCEQLLLANGHANTSND